MNQLLVIWVPSPFRSWVCMQPCHFVVHFDFHPGRIKSMQQIQMYTNLLYANLESFAQLAQKVAFCQTQRLALPLLSHGALCLGDGLRSDLWGCGLAARDFCVVACFAFRMCCPSGMCLKTGSENHPLPQKILAHLLSKKSFSEQKDLFLAKISMEFSSFLNLPLSSCHLIGRWTDEVGAQPGCEGEGSALLCNLDRQESHPHILLGPSLLLMLSVGAEGHCQRL